MSNKLIITNNEKHIFSSLFDKKELIQINVDSFNKESLLGSIYIGKIRNIIKNINAAFIEIADGVICYLSLEEIRHAIFCNPKLNDKVNIGDEMIVQVNKENIKTKAPVVTCNLNFTGKYVVLTHGRAFLGISSKITGEIERIRLKKIVQPYYNVEYGFIIRTNSLNASEECIQEEISILTRIYEDIKIYGIHKTRFSLLYKSPSNYICEIRDGFAENLDEIVTDNIEIYKAIQEYLSIYQKEDISKLRFYEDDLLSLNNLYGVAAKLENALKEKVWLKSGGSLVIQPTEALTAIDVNTGKAVAGKKKVQDTFFKINQEAAVEIGKQLRLRNLSGIIIIDFINMEKQEHRDQLMLELSGILNKDQIKTTLVDMTALNLVEITRKKVRKPLYEQF